MALGLSLILNLSNVINFAMAAFSSSAAYVDTITPYVGSGGAGDRALLTRSLFECVLILRV